MPSNLSRGLGRAVALAGLVFAPIVVIAPSANAISAPSNLSPGGDVSSNTPKLSWGRPSGAAKFEVQVDNDPGFGSPELNIATTNTRYVPKVLLRSGPQSWRVRALTSGGTESSWASQSFTIDPVSSPTPLSPVDGAELAQPNDPPLLTWSGTQGAASYLVEVDTEDDFLGPTYKTYSTQTTSLVVPDPLSAPEYFWRVTAVKGTGISSLPSSPVSFRVTPLEPVVLRSPADSPTTQVEDVVLDWDPVPGAQYYQLRVATDSDFNTRVDDEIKVPKIYGTSYSPKVTYNNNQYFWQVRAVDLAGKPTSWTTVNNSFNRVWPDRPQPVYPAGDGVQVVTEAPYFQWTPVQHASHYQLDVGSDPNFSPNTYDSCQVTGTTYTPGNGVVSTTDLNEGADEDCLAGPGNTMYWRVRPLDRPFTTPGVQGIYSATQTFRFEPSYVTNVSPADGATVDVPTFTWTARKEAQKYLLEVHNSTGTRVVNATTFSTSYTPVDISRLDPAKSPYTWRLTAVEANGTQSVTQIRSFSVSGNIPTTGDPGLTPHSGRSTDPATLRAPNLTWEPLAGADHYRVWFRNAGASSWWTPEARDAFLKDLPYPAMTDTGTRVLQPGRYDWFVQAFNEDNSLIGSGPLSTFQIADFVPVTGQELAVDGSTLDSGTPCAARLDANGVTGPRCDKVPTTPVFSWDRQPGAAFYILYISEDASFTNLVERRIPATTNTRYAFTLSNNHPALPESQAGQAYFWHVRPCRAIGSCAPDPVSSTGMASNAFRKESPKIVTAPVPTEVVGGQPVVTTGEVTLDWDDYFDTNRDTSWLPTGELSNQSAMQYHVQVSTTDTFSTRVDDVLVDQSTYTAFNRLYPDGTLYWRVQAIDGAGNGLTWSTVRQFVKSSPSATLSYPLGGAHVSGTTPFRWQAQPFNASYRIEVYKNADLTFSAANRVFYKDVKTTAYAWNETIPASSTAYVWRVRRTDGYGNEGAWSSTGRFFSDGSVPTALAPTDRTYQSNNGPLFTWTDVPGAASYVLEYKRGTSTTSVTTAATGWATDRVLGDGTYTWRVTAKDPSRNVLGLSGWRTFYVDGTAPKVVSYTPKSAARRTTNVTATFSEAVKGVSGTTVRLYLGKSKVRAKVTYSASKRRATLNPRGYLKRGRTYTMKVSGAIKDSNGNAVVAKKWTVRIK